MFPALGLVLLCSVPGVLAVTLADQLPVLVRGVVAEAGPTASRSPLDPAQAEFVRQVTPLLDRQAAALLRGDESGFVAVAEPAAPAVADLKRRFRSLRAMQVAVWRPELRAVPVRSGDRWRVAVTVQHCFVDPDCRPGPVTIGTVWTANGPQPRLVAVESRRDDEGPRPWEVSELVAAVGERTVIATTRNFRDRLPLLLAEAEQAAVVADRYAVDGIPPDRYRIFYAGAAQWKRWYGGGRSDWTAGYAIAVGGGAYELVLNSADLHRTVLDDLLRHELAHAASLPTHGYAGANVWWLVEGIAEYSAAGGRPLRRYENLADVRRLLGSGRWNGRLDGGQPPPDAAEWEVGGRYGIGYLAVRHLVDRFGEPALLAFFEAVVHDDRPLAHASRDAFGEEWNILHDECVANIRRAAA